MQEYEATVAPARTVWREARLTEAKRVGHDYLIEAFSQEGSYSPATQIQMDRTQLRQREAASAHTVPYVDISPIL